MRWDTACWVEHEDASVRSWVYKRLEHAQYEHEGTKGSELRPWQPNRHRVANVLDALAAATHLEESADPSAWLVASPVPAGQIVACRNGLLDITTKTLSAHTPRLFNRVAVPFDWSAGAPEPSRWLRFLDQLWPDDPDSITALAQFFGYVLSGRTDLHKILLLIGPTHSGKGTIARVLTALIGAGNVAGPTLASLGTNFGLAPLLGKPLALVSDARLGGQGVHQVVERLLSVSGEDVLTIDRKYREPWTGKLPSRFLILSNELPRFGDASGAIARRFVVLTLTRSENTTLTSELLTELPGVLNWALDGLDQLRSHGRFAEPASSADAILALQDLTSPLSAFVRDRCVTGAGHEIAVATLYREWKSWCEDNGHKPGSTQSFGRDLRSVVPALRITHPWVDEKTRERRYSGIAVSTTHNGADRVPRVPDPAEPIPGTHGTQSSPLSAQLDASLCHRCRYPADRLIPGPGGIQLCPACAYPAGGAPGEDTEEDQ